jgi:hypothetical protein
LTIHDNGIVTGFSFPRTDGMGVAGLKIVLIDGICWKIVVSFYDFTAIAFG